MQIKEKRGGNFLNFECKKTIIVFLTHKFIALQNLILHSLFFNF